MPRSSSIYHSPERPDGPGRTVYTDARLEVAGAELSSDTRSSASGSPTTSPAGRPSSTQIGRPSIMVDHQDNAQIGATPAGQPALEVRLVRPDRRGLRPRFVRRARWPVTQVDFAAPALPARRRQPSRTACRRSWPRRRDCATTRISRSAAGSLPRPLDLAGARLRPAARRGRPRFGRGLEDRSARSSRSRSARPAGPAFRMPFDPVFDLSAVRATYAFRRASSWPRATS